MPTPTPTENDRTLLTGKLDEYLVDGADGLVITQLQRIK